MKTKGRGMFLTTVWTISILSLSDYTNFTIWVLFATWPMWIYSYTSLLFRIIPRAKSLHDRLCSHFTMLVKLVPCWRFPKFVSNSFNFIKILFVSVMTCRAAKRFNHITYWRSKYINLLVKYNELC